MITALWSLLPRGVSDDEILRNLSSDEGSLSELNGVEVATLILLLVSLIVVLSVGFELLKDWLFETVDDDFKPVVTALFSELTTLGALSLISYVLVESKILDLISDAVFGINVVSDSFELVHMGLFLVAVVFMIQVAVFLHLGSKLDEQWSEWNRAVQEPEELKKMEDKLIGASKKERKALQAAFEFHSLRCEFIAERSPLPPFAPKDKDKQLKGDFAYDLYLKECYANTMAAVVEVPISAWLALWVLLLVFYFIMLGASSKIYVLMWVWMAFGWVLLFSLFAVDRKIKDIRRKLMNPIHLSEHIRTDSLKEALTIPDLPHWTQIEWDQQHDAKAAAAAAAGSGGGGGAANGISGSDHSRSGRQRQKNAKKKSPYVNRVLRAKARNRQQALYTFGEKGKEYNIFCLRLLLFLNAIYFSVLCMVYEAYVFENMSIGEAVAYTILSLAPFLLLTWNAIESIGALVHVSNFGVFRDANTVAAVVRRQKTARAMYTLLLINRLRVSMDLHNGNLEAEDPERLQQMAKDAVGDPRQFISDDQIEEIEATFDTFDKNQSGTVDDKEVQQLLKTLGMSVPDHELRRVVSTLDIDDSGSVSKQEFVWWYAKQMHSAPEEAPEETFKALFKTIDQDGSGVVTLSEMQAALDRLGAGLSLDEVADLFREMDSDHSGSVDEEEFVAMLVDNIQSDLLESK